MIKFHENKSLKNLFYIAKDGRILEEEWRDIKQYKNKYMVSCLGRFKRLERTVVHCQGKFTVKEEIMKGCISPKGYLTVGIGVDLKHQVYRRHRLVAQTFLKNHKNKPDVNHINGIKWDNRVENLEWCTPKENINHAIKTGLIKCTKGVNNMNAKLTDKKVLEIINRYNSCMATIKILAEEYSVSDTTINRIIKRKDWKHLNN